MTTSLATAKAAALACAAALALTAAPSSAEALEGLPSLQDVAPDAVQISPHIPHMGEHWAEPDNVPTGPIYCVIEGRVACVEFMFEMTDLEAGKDWVNLAPGIHTPPISHIDIEFKPGGIEPNPVLLDQVHIYLADPDTLARH